MISPKFIAAAIMLALLFVNSFAQLPEPRPGNAKAVTVPKVAEKTLPNGLRVAVVRMPGVPLVTARLVIRNGAGAEPASKAGLADLTAALLTKGTKTRSATDIAESIEFLGGSIASGAGWNGSFAAVSVTSDKVAQALGIFSDVVLNPSFQKEEIDLLKSQTLDGLTYSLKQPSFLASHAASKYSFGEHPAGGTKASIESITREEVIDFYRTKYRPDVSVLVFTGDITPAAATAVASRYLGKWKNNVPMAATGTGSSVGVGPTPLIGRILVVDLPKSGQAAVTYAKRIRSVQRDSDDFFTASVVNSILGGGYSSRLNSEIRIKRGLSYGAGSSFGWRSGSTNFSAQVQTKNESAAEVAELVAAELKRVTETNADANELTARKAVLNGGFGRNFETGGQLAAAIGDLHVFGLPVSNLSSYIPDIEAVTAERLKQFSAGQMLGGDLIIVGDYSIFKENLAQRFPSVSIEVIKADELDLNKDNLRK